MSYSVVQGSTTCGPHTDRVAILCDGRLQFIISIKV